jgi:hypothetical protein
MRPTGVTILAVLAFIFAALWIIGGFFAVVVGGAASFVVGPLGALGVAGGALMLLWGGVLAVVGYGLWTLQPWAWTLAVVVFAINLLFGVVEVFADVVGGLLSVIVNGLLLWYLFQPHVRGAFRQLPPARPGVAA